MLTMSPHFCASFFLLFVCLNERVSAECSDSLICGEETIEILLIAAVIAVCVMFLVLCIVVLCLARKFAKLKLRLKKMSLSRGTYTYHTTFPHLSFSEKGSGSFEDVTYMPDRRERHFSTTFPGSKRRSIIRDPHSSNMELTVVDNPDVNDNKEIWNLY